LKKCLLLNEEIMNKEKDCKILEAKMEITKLKEDASIYTQMLEKV